MHSSARTEKSRISRAAADFARIKTILAGAQTAQFAKEIRVDTARLGAEELGATEHRVCCETVSLLPVGPRRLLASEQVLQYNQPVSSIAYLALPELKHINSRRNSALPIIR